MTKRRRWEDPNLEKTPKQEDWRAAATREAAEKLGRTFRQAEGPVRLLDEAEYKQSDVDGIWKRYAFSVFGLAVADGTAWAPNVIAEWHTREEFATLAPISHTALYVLACLEREGLLPPW
jgi:hypothetical protein